MIKKPVKKIAKKSKKSSKTLKKSVKQKNPIKQHKSNNLYYIQLSDFIKEFNKEIKNKLDDDYYQFDYEFDNILKYSFRNSNLVSSGIINLISLTQFKKIMIKGLEHRFLESGYYVDIIVSFEKTILKIPNGVEEIDIGN